MIIKCDEKALEWRTYLELSKDIVGVKEILNKEDVHTNNQKMFNLPSRLISKKFLFRWIYRGSAYAYSVDPDFEGVEGDKAFWQSVINTANRKYHVLFDYQNEVIYRAKQGDEISIPTGRKWRFKPKTNRKGEAYISDSDITNYINQGFGAEITAIVRRVFRKKRKALNLPEDKVLIINTVHDDIELDVDNSPNLLYDTCLMLEDMHKDIPDEFEELFDYRLTVPFDGEVSFGPNLKDLIKFDREKGKEQFYAT